jgi:hypothetical protein
MDDYLESFNYRSRKIVSHSDEPKINHLIQLSLKRSPTNIVYSGGSDSGSVREIIPEKVTKIDGFNEYYLEAWCNVRNAERLFRIDRLEFSSDNDIQVIRELENEKSELNKDSVVPEQESVLGDVVFNEENTEVEELPDVVIVEKPILRPIESTNDHKEGKSLIGVIFNGLIGAVFIGFILWLFIGTIGLVIVGIGFVVFILSAMSGGGKGGSSSGGYEGRGVGTQDFGSDSDGF